MKYIFLFLSVLFSAPSLAECGPREYKKINDTKDLIVSAIKSDLPSGWIVTSEEDNTLPYRHYWGTKYDGVRGFKLQLLDPEKVHISWQSLEDGIWRESTIANEVLTLWFMPPSYSHSWKRFFVIGKPAEAKVLYADRRIKVFYTLGHSISDRTSFDTIISSASSLHWSSSPGETGKISWSNWYEDILRIIEHQESPTCP